MSEPDENWSPGTVVTWNSAGMITEWTWSNGSAGCAGCECGCENEDDCHGNADEKGEVR